MDFSYTAYKELINMIRQRGYSIVSYNNFEESLNCVIMRHDVDYSLKKAAEMALLEKSCEIKSTYFLMLTNDFYNVFSLQGENAIRVIKECGHDIGLHFDEQRYPDIVGNVDLVKDKIIEEASILSHAISCKVSWFSMHRPSKEIIEADIDIPGMINTYNSLFYSRFKYVSDSRRRWREPIEEIIESNRTRCIQILIHPFWYYESIRSIEETVEGFVNSANRERYYAMEENITALSEIMLRERVRD